MIVSPPEPAFATALPPWPARDGLRITAVRAIVTAPGGTPLVVVRVDTNEPGLYGLGCATFTQRWRSVVTTVEEHVSRLVVGRHPGDIEDISRAIQYGPYWRGGPISNNALSGVDMALWDLLGKSLGVPVYALLGGRVRAQVPTYTHASGATVEETLERAAEIITAGWQHVRLQSAQPGLGSYGYPGVGGGYPDAPNPDGWDVRQYLDATPRLFEQARDTLGDQVQLLHDAHSRLDPKEAILLARRLEPYHLLYLEDVLAPEHFGRLDEVRTAAPIPIAAGELCTSLTEAARLVTTLSVDYLRCHISAIGGLSQARKLVALAELHSIRTAWHSPPDVSPVGVAANVALDVTSPAFGILECYVYPQAVHDVFPGTLTPTRGHLAPHETPGWGIDLDEELAARFPPTDSSHDRWALGVRSPDGALLAP
ncbi:starvation-sensing protein RspA [Ruania alkalisoli]|uniref:Starvation-sensing protein RspA n=1 Tax=Ruania alkalisoli TaxID=2779775 RepID=A0A7M1SW40_9MICO|nr:enolase C-terminal domain-like protein [Ruania alkalisoli]QOR71806.1 starvation-sensing protein RspA [Ruania alkalisoli]